MEIETSGDRAAHSPVVFLVDDEKNNILLFERSLKNYDYDLRGFSDGREVLDALRSGQVPDLILSDVMMPRVDGFELCKAVKSDPRTAMVPVVLVTGMTEVRDRVRGLDTGADDFLHKPFHPLELRARVKSLLRIKRLTDLLSNEKLHLEKLVRERTVELESLSMGLVTALEHANKMNDEDTGNHIRRVCLYSRLLAKGLGLSSDTVLKVYRFASLHDVGKVGVPDHILKKPGDLTEDEWSQMRRHTVDGYTILKLAGADLVAMNIALCHHERWDGAGYPYGLRGKETPVEARIVALADAYDAMTTQRCYKDAYPPVEAERRICGDSGVHFDPDVVQVLLGSPDDVRAIREEYTDASQPAYSKNTVPVDAPPIHLVAHIEDIRGRRRRGELEDLLQ